MAQTATKTTPTKTEPRYWRAKIRVERDGAHNPPFVISMREIQCPTELGAQRIASRTVRGMYPSATIKVFAIRPTEAPRWARQDAETNERVAEARARATMAIVSRRPEPKDPNSNKRRACEYRTVRKGKNSKSRLHAWFPGSDPARTLCGARTKDGDRFDNETNALSANITCKACASYLANLPR